MESLACIGLGSNLGDRRVNICAALTGMAGIPGVEVLRVSSLYETAPWGGVAQDSFLNGVVQVRTRLDPHHLLEELLSLEQQIGRIRQVRWGPRLIDLDLLLYGDVELDTDTLQLPHPRMTVRAFVLVPLVEILPEVNVGGLPAQDHLALLEPDRTPGDVVWWGEAPRQAEKKGQFL